MELPEIEVRNLAISAYVVDAPALQRSVFLDDHEDI
jgi:hypothetical protein